MAENISYKKITKAESNYLGEWDMPLDGSDIVFTIKDAGMEEVKIPARGLISNKLVITFEETDKKFVCNDTNGGLISKALGTKILSEWVGKKVQLYSNHNIRFGNSTTSAIRVRPIAPTSSKPQYICSVCGCIMDEKTYKASIAKYEKSYCSKECYDLDTKGKTDL